MRYSFSCPAPCRKVFQVNAHTEEEAITKILGAGALRCRNTASSRACDEKHRHMPVLSDRRLREIVRVSMEPEPTVAFPLPLCDRATERSQGAPSPGGAA